MAPKRKVGNTGFNTTVTINQLTSSGMTMKNFLYDHAKKLPAGTKFDLVGNGQGQTEHFIVANVDGRIVAKRYDPETNTSSNMVNLPSSTNNDDVGGLVNLSGYPSIGRTNAASNAASNVLEESQSQYMGGRRKSRRGAKKSRKSRRGAKKSRKSRKQRK